MVLEVLSELPKEFQLPLIKAFTAMRDELAESVRREDFNELKAVVQELAEAQKRTEARVEELAEAQKRTETKVEELAEAQKRTEARVDSLAQRMEELAEAQKRTEARVEELAVAQKETQEQIKHLIAIHERTEVSVRELHGSLDATRKMMAGLSDSVGFTLEDRAIKNLAPLLEERFGLKVLEKLSRKFLPYAGGSIEVDIYGVAEKEGKKITLIGEAKTHLSTKHIDRFLHQIEKLKILEAVKGEVFPFMVSYSIHPDVELYARQKSVALFPSYEI